MNRGQRATLAAVVLMAPASVAASDTMTYTYDALGRLTGVAAAGGRNDGVTVSTGYDPAGNRSNHSVVGAGPAGLAPASQSASSSEEATAPDEARAEEEVPAATIEAPPAGGIPDESEPAVEDGAPPEDGGAAGASGADR